MARAGLFAAFLCALLAGSQAALVAKQLAGPPEEFSRHSVPAVDAGALTSSAALIPIVLGGSQDGSVFEHDFHVDSSEQFAFEIYSPIESSFTLALTDTKGHKVDLDCHRQEANLADFDGKPYAGVGYVIKKPQQGAYHLTVTASGLSVEEAEKLFTTSAKDRNGRHGFIVFYSQSTDHLYTHLNTFHLVEGESIGVGAMMFDEAVTPFSRLGARPRVSLNDTIETATMTVEFPDGSVQDFQMKDDGLTGADGLANDGEYGATFKAAAPGTYIVQATLVGKNSHGEFERSTEHLVRVVPRLIGLTGNVEGVMDTASQRLTLELEATNPDPNTAKYRVYAQVWGTKDGELAPACWVGTMSAVNKASSGSVSLNLQVDAKWLSRAGVSAPFQLRDVQVEDVVNYVPLVQYESLAVKMTPQHVSRLGMVQDRIAAANYTGEISREMREGVRPPRNVTAASAGGLVMVHGYCSTTNPWEASSDIFQKAIYFKKLNVGLDHDSFAELVDEFATANNYQSYAVVGFSQGGMVSTHLLNNYMSGLDHAASGRLVQSLGSPYLGNTLSGTTADLGKLFGVGCGAVSDMTVDGAARWAATISTFTASNVYYYTTQYNKGGLFGEGWCNAWANLVIKLPNDGVAEYDYSQLPGAHHVSHTKGECHLDGQNWPVSTANRARNAEINAAAARSFA